MKIEYQLILKAVLVNKTQEEEDYIDNLLKNKIDWVEVAGYLFTNRLGGYFYNGLSSHQRRYLTLELFHALRLLVNAQQVETTLNVKYLLPILEALEKEKVCYAGLKGLIFNADFYNVGARRSNDVDLLVNERSLAELDKILRDFGYIQSFLPDGNIVEASKKEKLIQRMNYHDLVPYVKKVDWGISEIDINFLFDSKENIIDYEIFDYGTLIYNGADYSARGLPLYTNLAFLCIHFHREATNTLWTINGHDVVLYKVIDIMNTIRVHRNELKVDEWVPLMKKLNLQIKCYYTFYVLSQFYEDPLVNSIEEALRPEDTSFLEDIKVEGENRTIKRTEKFIESAFSHNR